ncbi:cyanuric acid hydrolase/Barbiturase [Aspergillus spectabilis]
MAAVTLFKYPTSSPADTSPLAKLEKDGYQASDVIAVVGKTEGNGCVNDFSRTLSTHVWESKVPSSAVTVFSGGTEGVLSPHVTLLVHAKKRTGLVACSGQTRDFAPHDVGSDVQVQEVSETVSLMIEQAGIDKESVHLVLIKCPLLTSTDIDNVRKAGQIPVTVDTYESMAVSRYASALGIAVALGEISLEKASGAMHQHQETVWSARASCSSGAELQNCHIMILAEDPLEPRGQLRATSSYMKDAMDANVVLDILSKVNEENGKVVQVFAKAEADPSGSIRGLRHTMNTDSDIHSTRHARAAVGGLIGGLVGDSAVYISGGGEGQGPPGGGSLCIVYEV